MGDRILSGEELHSDVEVQKSLRPRRFSEYIGQEKLKQKLSIFMEAAQKRSEPIDHVLLYGPPGLGKEEAGRRRHRGALSGHLHRAEDGRPQPPVHRGDGHRDL